MKAPPTLDHRYLHEDVGWGLVQWMNLANVPTPTMQALTTLADYYIDGLTLERMGMAGMAGKDVVAYAHAGPQYIDLESRATQSDTSPHRRGHPE